jgi:hypothetical protein
VPARAMWSRRLRRFSRWLSNKNGEPSGGSGPRIRAGTGNSWPLIRDAIIKKSMTRISRAPKALPDFDFLV